MYNLLAMKRTPGLRTQLFLGLTLIIVVASISVGVITVWSTRQQMAHVELENSRLMGYALANMLSVSMAGRPTDERIRRRVMSSISLTPGVLAIEVRDAQLNVLAKSQGGGASKTSTADLAAAINTKKQVVSAPEDQKNLLVVSTPILIKGKLKGAVRLETLLNPDRSGWPRLFWSMMLLDGLVMIFFVILVLTRYVIRPVEAMQRAAARVAEGDLTVKLAQDGPRELSSLADSFNSMTSSVQEQLERIDRQRWELAASRQHLITSEKLASVGRLAAGVAHEVGNPMQSIIGFTEMLLQGGLDRKQQQDILDRVRKETQRIHHILRDLLDYARPVEDAVEAVDLAAVVEQSLQLVGPQKRLQQVEVKIEGLKPLPPVAANSQRLIQVLVNLLLNAADAMKGSGTITFEGVTGGEQVKLRVSNDGPEIPRSDRDRIFEPFFSTKDVGSGTGLGLSVAQSIVESFDGGLSLAEAGSPTTFVITLPVFNG